MFEVITFTTLGTWRAVVDHISSALNNDRFKIKGEGFLLVDIHHEWAWVHRPGFYWLLISSACLLVKINITLAAVLSLIPLSQIRDKELNNPKYASDKADLRPITLIRWSSIMWESCWWPLCPRLVGRETLSNGIAGHEWCAISHNKPPRSGCCQLWRPSLLITLWLGAWPINK